jgi:hypothetical protein
MLLFLTKAGDIVFVVRGGGPAASRVAAVASADAAYL